MISDNAEIVLTNLGLTSSQARVYLALVHLGPSKVVNISQASKIHRAHLYETLAFLEERGLVEKHLDGSTTYKAVPLKQVIPMLMKHKHKELTKLEIEAKTIMHIAQQRPIAQVEQKAELLVTSSKSLTLNKVEKYFQVAKGNIEFMHTWKRFVQLWEHYESTFGSAMARGVKIRQIVEQPTDASQLQEVLSKKRFANKSLEIRFVPRTGGNFAVIDDKRILLSTSKDKENLGETPFLISNYEGILGLFQTFFELAWKNATPKECLMQRTASKKAQSYELVDLSQDRLATDGNKK